MTHISATRFYSMMGYGAPFFVLQAMGVDQSAVPHDILAVIGYFGGLGYGTYKGYRMNADPGRLQLEANLGLIGMSLGGFSAYVFSETNSQTGGLMVVGATGAGMLVGKYYRAGEKLPMGVGAGILLETILWSGLGFGVIAQTTHSSEFKSKVMMAGMGFGGAGIALYTHRNSYSTLFRTVLDGVGVGLGVLVGSLVGQRIGGEKAIAAALSISVPVHYITFHWLTRGMQHKPIDEEQANHIHFNPLPQIWMSKQADGTFKKGWHVQALRVTF
jgi:hypothetical protein